MLRPRIRPDRNVIPRSLRAYWQRDNIHYASRVHYRAAATSSSPRKSNASINDMPPSRRLALYGSLGVTLLTSFYAAQIITALTKANSVGEHGPDLATQKDVASRYDEIANSFDSDVNFSEWLMGILSLRKLLAHMCHGNVLEVSCGTGRNLGYFDFEDAVEGAPSVKSLTFVDLSDQMVQVCKRKWAALHGVKSLQTGYWKQRPIRFLACSALEQMPVAPDGIMYDTILQTMGLCSTPSPEELIRNLAPHLNVANPDAHILLLEHGRSTQTWLNRVLDNTAEKHAENYGCWYNRDIDGIVQRAAEEAGLEVVQVKRAHLGTTFVYELKAGQKLRQQVKMQQEKPNTIMRKESIVNRAWERLFGR